MNIIIKSSSDRLLERKVSSFGNVVYREDGFFINCGGHCRLKLSPTEGLYWRNVGSASNSGWGCGLPYEHNRKILPKVARYLLKQKIFMKHFDETKYIKNTLVNKEHAQIYRIILSEYYDKQKK